MMTLMADGMDAHLFRRAPEEAVKPYRASKSLGFHVPPIYPLFNIASSHFTISHPSNLAILGFVLDESR